MVLNKQTIIIIFVFAVVVTLLILLFGGDKKVNKLYEKPDIKDKNINNNPDTKVYPEGNENTNNAGGLNPISGGSGGGGGGSEGANNIGSGGNAINNDTNDSINELPNDLYTNSCGYYYNEYEICAGYCEIGTCVSEERSCYCKE